MHSFWLLLFVIKLYSHINIFKVTITNVDKQKTLRSFDEVLTYLVCYSTSSLTLHSSIVIRNGKIVWKVDWIEYYCGWTWVPEDTSIQATSEYIICKHWKYRKIKTTVLFMWATWIELDWIGLECFISCWQNRRKKIKLMNA